MTYKQVLISAQLHRRVRIATALRGQSIKAFTEEALLKHLESFSLPRAIDNSTEVIDEVTRDLPEEN
mgnify:CR=1 FL=1